MGAAVPGSARRGPAAGGDISVHRRHTHHVWRSDGVYEGAGLLVRPHSPLCLLIDRHGRTVPMTENTPGTSQPTPSRAIGLRITRPLFSSTASLYRQMAGKMDRQVGKNRKTACLIHRAHTYCKPRCGSKMVQRWKRRRKV